MERTSDFVVVTQGICFLCRDKIEIDIKSESILESIVKRNQSANQSIQYISRYLKMDMGKVFISDGAIALHLLDKVKRSRLKVELCDVCSRLNETFAKLFRKLEKAEIELHSCLRKIARKLTNNGDGAKDDQVYKLTKCEPNDVGLVEKLEIAEALRTDAVQKCNQKMKMVRDHGLRIKVIKLAPYEIPFNRSTISDVDAGMGAPDYDESDNWDAPDNMEVDDDIRDSYRQSVSVVTTSRQNFAIDNSKFSVRSKTGKVKCNVCLKEYAGPDKFRRHYMAAHLNVRFECNICHANFTQKENLMRHKRTVHFGQRFKCKYCSDTFSSASRRTNHIKTRCNKFKFNDRPENSEDGIEMNVTDEEVETNGAKSDFKQEMDGEQTNVNTVKLEPVEFVEPAPDADC